MNAVGGASGGFFVRQPIVVHSACLVSELHVERLALSAVEGGAGAGAEQTYMFQTIPLTSTLSVDVYFVVKGTET